MRGEIRFIGAYKRCHTRNLMNDFTYKQKCFFITQGAQRVIVLFTGRKDPILLFRLVVTPETLRRLRMREVWCRLNPMDHYKLDGETEKNI